jgi:hypothetical protein
MNGILILLQNYITLIATVMFISVYDILSILLKEDKDNIFQHPTVKILTKVLGLYNVLTPSSHTTNYLIMTQWL